MARTEVIEERFSADQAGERVGWVRMSHQPMEGAEDLIHVQATIGTVGEDGAVVSYMEDGEHKLMGPNSVKGFQAVSAIGGVILQESGIKDHSQVRLTSSGRHRYVQHYQDPSSLMHNGLESRHQGALHRVWVDSPTDLLDTLRGGLQRFGVGDTYSHLYFLLNHATMHADFAPNDITGPNSSEWMLVDPKMHDKTKAENTAAEEVTRQLKLQIENDEDMKRALTIFGKVPAREVPDYFVASRQKAHQLEVAAIEESQKMVVRDAVFLPAGFHPDGRSWRYMDQACGDEAIAFGQELASLKSGYVERTNSELDYEINELEKRASYAFNGKMVLNILANAEKRAATA